jgi:hypothetical protein
MKARVSKKPSTRHASAKKVTKRLEKKAVTPKSPARSAGKRISTRDAKLEAEAMTHFISRPFLSPIGKREISSRRITAAIKAVMKAQGSYDF